MNATAQQERAIDEMLNTPAKPADPYAPHRAKLIELQEANVGVSFDLDNKKESEAYRSYVHALRSNKKPVDDFRMSLTKKHRDLVKTYNDAGNEIIASIDVIIEPHAAKIKEHAEREAERTAALEKVLDELRELWMPQLDETVDSLEARLALLEGYNFPPMQEQAEKAAEIQTDGIAALKDRIAAAQKVEADAKRLAELEAKEKAREVKEAAETKAKADAETKRIADEAAEKKAQARAKEIAAEKETAAQKEIDDAKAAQKKAESDAKQAEVDAAAAKKKAEADAQEREKQAAAKAIADREMEEAKERAAEVRRQANQVHRDNIHSEIDQFIASSITLSDVDHEAVIALLVSGDVPHLSIQY